MSINNPEWAHLDEVKERVLKRFADSSVVREIHFIPINAKQLEIYVFFNRDEDLIVCEKSGVANKIKDLFNEELERVNRGNSSGVIIRFEFDSHENVVRNFRGNYFLRLR